MEKVGGGEEKVCYKLTTPDGKKMAILLRGYSKKLGTCIPDDPKMVRIKDGPQTAYWEYLDLRTYLLHPVSPSVAIQFQEFGNNDQTSVAMNSGMIAFVKGKAAAYIHGKGATFEPDMNELNHPRHFLFNQGAAKPPAVIDIPVMQRKI